MLIPFFKYYIYRHLKVLEICIICLEATDFPMLSGKFLLDLCFRQHFDRHKTYHCNMKCAWILLKMTTVGHFFSVAAGFNTNHIIIHKILTRSLDACTYTQLCCIWMDQILKV